jgi:hypothetical protein
MRCWQTSRRKTVASRKVKFLLFDTFMDWFKCYSSVVSFSVVSVSVSPQQKVEDVLTHVCHHVEIVVDSKFLQLSLPLLLPLEQPSVNPILLFLCPQL